MRYAPSRLILLTCLAVVLTGLVGLTLLKMPGAMTTVAFAQAVEDQRVASARAVLEQAQANQSANPTEENAAAVDAALAEYNLAVATRIAEIQVRLMELAALNTGGQTKDPGITADAQSLSEMEYKALQDELVSLGAGAVGECAENFDGVTAPALPTGWTATTATDCVNSNPWATSTSGTPAPAFDTAPNAAFVNDPNCISDERLDSPAFPIVSPTAQLTFRNNFNMENGFDGGVLEVSTNGGATFQDILAAGGSFVTGGYTGTISVNFGNPLAGRMAWEGSSSGFITTTVNFPASFNGQSVILRFRRGTDSSVSGQGWRIDSLSISGANCGGDACTITCPANITQSNDPNQCGAVVNYPAPTTTGSCGTVTCSPASGSFFPVGTTTVTCTTTAGPSCSFTVTVNQDTPSTTTITAGPATIVTESCPPANGQIDVGERVTVHLELQNTGACPTNDLVATLVQGGGVTSPSDPQSYGALAPGSTDGRDFTFTAIGSCGGTLTATWNLNDGPNNLGTVTKTFTLACIAPSCGMVRLVVLVDSLTRTNATTVRATYRVRNIGTLLADDVTLTNAKLGSTTGGPLPTFIGDIPPDTSSPPFDVFFTNSTPGASSTLMLGGTYTGGTFASTRRVTIP